MGDPLVPAARRRGEWARAKASGFLPYRSSLTSNPNQNQRRRVTSRPRSHAPFRTASLHPFVPAHVAPCCTPSSIALSLRCYLVAGLRSSTPCPFRCHPGRVNPCRLRYRGTNVHGLCFRLGSRGSRLRAQTITSSRGASVCHVTGRIATWRVGPYLCAIAGSRSLPVLRNGAGQRYRGSQCKAEGKRRR